jgi:RHS repeat-associated protein
MLTKVTSSGTMQYNWDFENRLSSVVLPGSAGTVSFKYDPFGRRIEKSGPNATTNYVYDGPNTLEEVDGSGNILARYVQGFGIDQPLAVTRGSSTNYYEADGLGSITSLSNSSAALANTYTYASYETLTSSSGTVTNQYRFTSREFDTESGLYYYRARYYDSATGRFLNEDPDKDGAAGSLYAYVENSPISWYDQFGTEQSAPNPSATIVGPATPDQVSQINAGFAEALNRLGNSDCRKLFCKNKNNLDPKKVLAATQYEVSQTLQSSTGAATIAQNLVYLGARGIFFTPGTTANIPSDNPQISTKIEINFSSVADKAAFVLLHELGHQVGIFPPDVFGFINGRHSLRVLDACFKTGAKYEH